GNFTEDVGYDSHIRDWRMFQPRAGFAWNAHGGTNALVIRGGSGIFYGNTSSTQALEMEFFSHIYTNSYPNDGKPGFILDPTRGITAANYASGLVPLPAQSPSVIAHDFRFPHTWQTMLGFQKQLGAVMGVDADLVYQKGYNEEDERDANLF